jgi:hypothetical protein
VRLALLEGAVAGLPSGEATASSEDKPPGQGAHGTGTNPLKPRSHTGTGRTSVYPCLRKIGWPAERHHRRSFCPSHPKIRPRLGRYVRIEKYQTQHNAFQLFTIPHRDASFTWR